MAKASLRRCASLCHTEPERCSWLIRPGRPAWSADSLSARSLERKIPRNSRCAVFVQSERADEPSALRSQAEVRRTTASFRLSGASASFRSLPLVELEDDVDFKGVASKSSG